MQGVKADSGHPVPVERADTTRARARPSGSPGSGTRRGPWGGAFGSTRARMLAAFVVLVVVAGGLTTFTIHEVLVLRLRHRTDSALLQEVQEIRRLSQVGIDPASGRPFASVDRLLDVVFERNVTSDAEGFVSFVEGEHYRSSLERLPFTELPASVLSAWSRIDADRTGPPEVTGAVSLPLGEARYRALRLEAGGIRGSFVVFILPASELAEIRALGRSGALVTLVGGLLAGLAAWLLAGRILAPVRELTATARSISESDLAGRIQARGTSEAAEMAHTFNAMLDRLEAVYRSQRDFLHSAGHEFRAPLTVATGHLQLMGEDDRATVVPLVLDELGRMSRMVDDLLALAGSSHPDFLDLRPVDLGALTDDVMTRAVVLGDRRWELDETADGTIVADRDRLLQAMLNLAGNAVHHTEVGQVIGIGAGRRGAEVHLWVRDTGDGVPEADRDRIFGRFVRGEHAGRRYRGSGLGLAIVRTIAEAHGGSVEVGGGPGEGARFTIRLQPGEVGDGPDSRR